MFYMEIKKLKEIILTAAYLPRSCIITTTTEERNWTKQEKKKKQNKACAWTGKICIKYDEKRNTEKMSLLIIRLLRNRISIINMTEGKMLLHTENKITGTWRTKSRWEHTDHRTQWVAGTPRRNTCYLRHRFDTPQRQLTLVFERWIFKSVVLSKHKLLTENRFVNSVMKIPEKNKRKGSNTSCVCTICSYQLHINGSYVTMQ